jgi:uncharacterized membrane protein
LTRLVGLFRVQAAVWLLRLGESQWLLSLAGAVVGAVIGYAVVAYSAQISRVVPGTAWVTTVSEARSVLLAFIGVEITALSIVMSLTMVTIQNAASQFSPRVLRYYLRDLVQQTVLGVIAGSTTYFVIVATFLGLSGTSGPVSRPSLGLAVIFLVSSGVALVVQVNHTLQIIRLEVVLVRVVDITLRAYRKTNSLFEGADTVYSTPLAISEGADPVRARRSGYVSYIGVDSLLADAVNHNLRVRIDVEIGDYAGEGSTVGWVEAQIPGQVVPTSAIEQVSNSIGLSGWRSPKTDVGLGMRLFVDIAIRALSPAVNDPYTAAKSVDHLSATLVELAKGPTGSRTLLDEQGHPRVELRSSSLGDYLQLATDQITRYGCDEPSVIVRLVKMLQDIGLASSSEEHRSSVLSTLSAVIAEMERCEKDPEWIKTLRTLSSETTEALTDGRAPRTQWPMEL